jgi:hypothetical protein
MKKILILCAISLCNQGLFAQDYGKGDLSILKLDLVDLMGTGIQEIHFSYEFAPMEANSKLFPTLQFDLHAPTQSFIDDFNVDWGLKAATSLRFYFTRWDKPLAGQGPYYGIGLEGGWLSYSENTTYRHIHNFDVVREYELPYTQVRTGLHTVIGYQSRFARRFYFDINLGIGLGNFSSKQDEVEIDPNYEREEFWRSNVLLVLYDEGNYQRIFVPMSFAFGYNFKYRKED